MIFRQYAGFFFKNYYKLLFLLIYSKYIIVYVLNIKLHFIKNKLQYLTAEEKIKYIILYTFEIKTGIFQLIRHFTLHRTHSNYFSLKNDNSRLL